jgi:hypothetical protein
LDNGHGHKTIGEIAGTSRAYTLARLERDEPALAARVLAGELSAHAAAIEAGWRKPSIRYSLPTDAADAGRYLASRVDRAWFEALIDAYYQALPMEEVNSA